MESLENIGAQRSKTLHFLVLAPEFVPATITSTMTYILCVLEDQESIEKSIVFNIPLAVETNYFPLSRSGPQLQLSNLRSNILSVDNRLLYTD